MEDRLFLEKIPQIRWDSLPYKELFYDPPKKKKTTTFVVNNKTTNIPIIIDYGSGITKAGWGNSPNADLVFRSVVAKTKDSKNLETPVYVGNKLKEIDFLKLNYRSPFERNIVQHSGLLENINDYIFNELGVNDYEVRHPLLVTECFANPEYCRINTVEQFFECYNVPSVTFGVDCLFSYYANLEDFDKYKKNTTLLISLGNSTIHIVPIVHGQIQFMEIKRVNVGGSNCYEVFQKNLNLKFQNQKNKFSLKLLQVAYESLNYVAANYQDQLKYFKYGVNAFINSKYTNAIEYENNKIVMEEEIKTLISPVLIDVSTQVIEPVVVLNPEDTKKKLEMRREQAQRLKETMVKRKEERKKQQEAELKELDIIIEQKKKDPEVDLSQFKEKLNFYALDSIEDAVKRIKKLKIKLGLISKETLEEEKMSLLNIPDDKLNAEQIKQKKMQYIFKQAAETRALKKQKQKELKQEIQHLKETDPESYIKKLYEKRNHILDKIEMKKRQKIEINTRNSRFNQRRMQTLAHLGSDGNKNKKGIMPEDTFGINDDDWNVYRGISKDIGSDEENFEIKLNEIEIELRELDANYVTIKRPDESIYGLNTTSDLIELAVERIKGPEVLFQPKIGGIDQSGVSEVISQVLKNYSPEIQKMLLKNIFLTGGAALMNNLKKRLEVDLKASTPIGTVIKISIAKDPIFDTWKGMKIFSLKHNLHDFCITRRDYDEKGSSYYRENPFSNIIKLYE